MPSASAEDKEKAQANVALQKRAATAQPSLTGNKSRHRLDASRFSTSVQGFAASPRPAAARFPLSMKNLSIALSALLICSAAFAEEKPALKDTKDKVSYSIGLDIGTTLKRQKVDVNPDTLSAGLRDALSGAKPLMTDEQIKETMTAFSKDLSEKQAAASREAATKNTEAGQKFLAENKNKPGVKTTASGLQYKVIKEGTGPSPKETDTVVTNYRGRLLDGTEFDSSYKRNEPATFQVNRVIKGWTEALQLMKKGSKYELFIPSDLAYGPRGMGGDIGPNSVLIFEVELMDIKAGQAEAAPTPVTAVPSPTTAKKP
jgi:FKBP-type peptidyl-prolyl cis-trans isomerase FklB